MILGKLDFDMKLLTKEEMQKLNTKRLLAYKARLLRVRDQEVCWCGDRSCDYQGDRDLNAFTKRHPTWQELYANVKEVLKTREHVERK
jgi:hypothetical protein